MKRPNMLTSCARSYGPAAALGFVHWLTTFITEKGLLQVPPSENWFNYIFCKALLLVALPAFWLLLYRAIFLPESRERKILLYALPYLGILTLWLLKNHTMELRGDELNLFTRATKLDSFAYWFNYPSGWYWIMSVMLIPHHMGAVVIKMLLQSLAVGYCAARQRQITGKHTQWLLYPLFLAPFVLTQGISGHRLPTYGVLYLFLVAKLVYDYLEKKPLTTPTLMLVGLICGILGIWRTEGIYLLPLGLLLILCAYRTPLRINKELGRVVIIYALAILAAVLPQLKGYTADATAPVSLRTKPLCGYIICNMFRNGLTEDMIAEERTDIEGYLKLSTIHQYNEELGDTNYHQAYIIAGVEDADYPTQERFCAAVIRVVLKHPIIYLRSQLGAFLYTSTQYKLTAITNWEDILTCITSISSWVWPPCLLAAAEWIWSLLRRKWLCFWLTSGALANWGIVVLLMPAAFAKYFYATYLVGYFLALVGLCLLVASRRGKREQWAA